MIPEVDPFANKIGISIFHIRLFTNGSQIYPLLIYPLLCKNLLVRAEWGICSVYVCGGICIFSEYFIYFYSCGYIHNYNLMLTLNKNLYKFYSFKFLNYTILLIFIQTKHYIKCMLSDLCCLELSFQVYFITLYLYTSA